MKIQHDIHMHTKRCGHAEGEIEHYLEAAERAGLREIGFADHLPLIGRRDPGLTMDLRELPEYQRDIEGIRAKSGKVRVKVGIEADYLEGCDSKTRELLEAYPYDYVIGSVHFLKEWGFDDPRQKDRWDGEDVQRVWERYFRVLRDSAATGIFDIIGHPDLVKKFGHRPAEDMNACYRETAAVFKDCGVAVEVNTSGLRKPAGEIYPSLDLLKAFRDADVPIVFGSDAHSPAEVGADFGAARDLAIAAGYSEYLVFKQRKVERAAGL